MNTRAIKDLKVLALEHKDKLPYVVGAFVLLLIYAFSHTRTERVTVYESEKAEFKDGRVLGSNYDSIYEGKERLFSKTVRDLLATQTSLKESTEALRAKVEELEKQKATQVPPSPTDPAQAGVSTAVSGPPEAQATSQGNADPGTSQVIRLGAAPEAFDVSHYGGSESTYRRRSSRGGGSDGKAIISFPVKDQISEKTTGVVIPPGSYVKAKLMTGVEAPEGRTYPVLLQLDFAYIVPNKKKLDLSGCFMIAKSQGDLSTERVQMQASKLSCVSREGKMFERDVNGFIADDKDNSFAVIGSVNSKQDRVATMAFLSSVVEGVGKALGQAQTTQTTTPLGGSQSTFTGDQMTGIAAGGASNAAGLVTQWYLKQAQNLLPTINVGSGQNVWIVMQETVKLPNDYFRKNMNGGQNEGVFTYFSRAGE